jgi:hypothetical protein
MQPLTPLSPLTTADPADSFVTTRFDCGSAVLL